MKKKIFTVLLSSVMLLSMAACTGSSETNTNKGDSFETLIESKVKEDLSVGGTKSYSIDKEIGDKNYVKLDLTTSVPLYGEFVYANVDDTANAVTEPFFVEANSTEFTQFFDAYRTNGIGQFKKRLISVSLKNVGEVAGDVTLNSVQISSRKFPDNDREIYIESGYLKVGADLQMGGSLSYLERTSYRNGTIDEVIDMNNNVYIGIGAKQLVDNKSKIISSHVNLINVYDAGREIQQSYYANVGGSTSNASGANGYQRYLCYTADSNGYYWPYNPVQGGDEVCNVSQIVDYKVTNNTIYVKARSMDWANGYSIKKKPLTYNSKYADGRTTKSYTEAWYTIENDMLYVTNRFIDWNGFTNMEGLGVHSLEIPATYIVHPLNKYVCYTGSKPWTGDEIGLDQQSSLGPWKTGGYKSGNHPEDWFAWVNDADFGVGVYIPGAHHYSSGRSATSTSTSNNLNCNAFNAPILEEGKLFNKKYPDSPYMSCYVSNTDYTAPVVTVKMKEYVPLQYKYVVCVDNLKTIRNSFKSVHEAGEIDSFNAAGLTAWN